MGVAGGREWEVAEEGREGKEQRRERYIERFGHQ